RLGITAQHLAPAQAGIKQLRPGMALELTGKEAAPATPGLGLAVHVVHELVDQRNGDLLDLCLRVGHLADEDVAAGVDTTPGYGIEHCAPSLPVPQGGGPSLERNVVVEIGQVGGFL